MKNINPVFYKIVNLVPGKGKRLREKLLSFFKKLSLKKLGFLIFLVLALGTVFLIKYLNQKGTQPEKPSKAEETTSSSQSEFPSNELLIKVKKEAKGKIKEDPKNTGVASLDKIFNDHNVKDFKQIAKPGKNSKSDADIFDWYLITLNAPKETVKGKLDLVTKRIQMPTPNEKEEKSPDTTQTIANLGGMIEKLFKDPNIQDLQPNYILRTQLTPNDPFFDTSGGWGQTYKDMWGLHIINTLGAWDQTTGSSDIVVAVIDSGVDRNHPDIKDNMWVNTKEIPDNKIDDDGNGYVDDYYGWDFYNNDNDPMDDHGHGTHCSGTIAATGNNSIGIVGVNWTTKIMALKFIDSSGMGDSSNALKAFQYAVDNGARVSSNSYGGSGYDPALDDSIKYAHDKGMVIVVAAGNGNADALDHSPAGSQYAITVAASNHLDNKSSFSNWGPKIDVAAPGGDVASNGGVDDYILSLRASGGSMCSGEIGSYIGNDYCIARGTSMATPHVAGLAALLLAKNPNLTSEEVRQIIRLGADDLGTVGRDNDFGYGRINAFKSMGLVNNPNLLAPMIDSPINKRTISGPSQTIIGTAVGANFGSYKLEYGIGRSPSSWTLITTSTNPVTSGVLGTIDTMSLNDKTLLTIRLSVYDKTDSVCTQSAPCQFQIFDVEVDNISSEISYPNHSNPLGLPLTILGTAGVNNTVTTMTKYEIFWGSGNDPRRWETTNITLESNGTKPIVNGKLGTLTDKNMVGEYTIKLKVTSSSGGYDEYKQLVRFEKDIVSGWPKMIAINNSSLTNPMPPIFADIDGDTVKEIIFATDPLTINAYEKNGTVVNGFPIRLPVGLDRLALQSSPISDDFDNDGRDEIVVFGDTGVVDQDKYFNALLHIRLFLIKNNGSNYDVVTLPGTYRFMKKRIFTPAIYDLDKDNQKELVFADYDGWLYVMRQDGSNVFPPIKLGDPENRSPVVLADIDKDGEVEIIVAENFNYQVCRQYGEDGYYGHECSYANQPLSVDSSRLYVFTHQGLSKSGWPKTFTPTKQITHGPLIADLDGDKYQEIIIFTSDNPRPPSIYNVIPKETIEVFRYSGEPLSNWLVVELTNTQINSSYNDIIGDVDSDGKDEFIARDGIIIGAGGIEKTIPANLLFFTHRLADITGDNLLDYVGKVDSKNVAVYDNNLNSYWTTHYEWSGFKEIYSSEVLKSCGPSIGSVSDIDNNGRAEVAVKFNCMYSVIFPSNNFAWFYLYEIPTSVSSTRAFADWNMLLHDSQNTSRVDIWNKVPNPTTLPTPIITPTPTKTSTPAPTGGPTVAPTPIKTQTPSPTSPPSTKGTLTGVIKDAVIGGVVSGAKIDIRNSSGRIATVYTNTLGAYTTLLNPGTYTLTITARNYNRLVQTTIVTLGSNTLNISLTPRKTTGAASFFAPLTDFFANLFSL